MSVTWQRNGEAQGSREGAGGSAGEWWVDLAVSAIVREVLGAFLKLGRGP